MTRAETQFGLRIDGWSFVPHPEVMREIARNTGRELVRKVLAIETLRAKVYSAVREFLLHHTLNVNSYYTGGSADFICDVYLAEREYATFYRSLSDVLVTAGAGRIEDIENIVSVFRVDKPLVLAGRELSRLSAPTSSILAKIAADPARFETLYRNYASDAAKGFFRGTRQLQRFLQELRDEHAIVGFRPLLDGARYVDREYVPLCRGRALDKLLRNQRADRSAILAPAVDLLCITTLQGDAVEREATHIFFNEYSFPGQRHDWRCEIYETLGDDLNLFTFPLEGTLNESPISLSDLPEAMERARSYGSGALRLGTLYHASQRTSAPSISLDAQSLAFQGLTLGQSGTGKTNTDCVLIVEAAKALPHVVVLDTAKSRSLREKQDVFPADTRAQCQFIELATGLTHDVLLERVDKAIVSDGITVLEPAEEIVPEVLELVLARIESGTPNMGNAPRVLEGLLVIEEANDALGHDPRRRERVALLERVLTKAFRKGWCVWLSTQHPGDVGYDNVSAIRILRALHNRVVHQIDAADVALLAPLLGNLVTQQDLDSLTNLPKWTAMVLGTASDDGTMRCLPPVLTQVRTLGSEM